MPYRLNYRSNTVLQVGAGRTPTAANRTPILAAEAREKARHSPMEHRAFRQPLTEQRPLFPPVASPASSVRGRVSSVA